MTESPIPNCSHNDATELFGLCTHLWESQSNSGHGARDYYRVFTGRGLRRRLLCKACGEKGVDAKVASVHVCEECFLEVEDYGQRLGDYGVPEFAVRDGGLELISSPLLPSPGGVRVVQIAAIHAAPGSQWLVLTDRHELLRADFISGETRRICGLVEIGLPIDQELSLIVSNRGNFAVVAIKRGAIGAVLEMASSRVCMMLNRGGYHIDHCRFSAAFFEHDGKTLLVHATSWSRLDISDPSTSRLLTSREFLPVEQGLGLPTHHLDYFHCGLAVSPDGQWIADNGWVWHPMGSVDTWSLREWVTANVWESEDGPTRRSDIWRTYYWDGPMCWVGNRRLAVWGVGKDDYGLLPAVRFVDVDTGKEHPPLVGPFGPTTAAMNSEEAMQNPKLVDKGVLEFDDYLFAWSPAAGLSVWDVQDGARLFAVDFCPLAYHRGKKQFFSQDVAGNCVLAKLVEQMKAR